MLISKILIPNFVCVFSQIKDGTEFSFCCQGHASGWDLGVLGESKTLAWGFSMAPHRQRALVLNLKGQKKSVRGIHVY